MKKLAFNIITTNDEPYLERCLSSISKIDCDIIIGFNGNKDSDEFRLCEKYATKIITFEWTNNFAHARNIVLEQTENNWIIWIDSDEHIEQTSLEAIESLLDSNPSGMFHSFKLIHGNTSMGQVRLFFNNKKTHWKFPVHEKLTVDVYPVKHPEIQITHNIQNVERSYERNLKILLSEEQNTPDNADIHFYLAIEYHLMGRQMKSLLHAEKFLFYYNIPSVDVKKMYIRYLIAWINVYELDNSQKAAEIMFGQLVLNCNIAEFWCLLGDIYVKLGKFKFAKRFYENAVEMGQYKFDNMWIVDNSKYSEYPKLRISHCNKYIDFDYQEFKKELSSPIIP